MDAQVLLTYCPQCGYLIGFIDTVMVTADSKLTVTGDCDNCDIKVISYVPLTELYKITMQLRKEKPKGSPLKPPLKTKAEVAADTAWLHELGVKG
jgi:hypothetical protein